MDSVCQLPSSVQYPAASLSNGLFNVSLYLPDERVGYYRGSRFDWSGLISQVEYNGHTFFGDWKTGHNPVEHDDIVGPAEEFGMFSPLGYDQARNGEGFIKIGIGLLRRPDEHEYKFYKNYKVLHALPWRIDSGSNWIEFHQELSDDRGWGYVYTKRISLSKTRPALRIGHSLKNTGTRPISTEQYCHNFILLDEQPIGPDYRVVLPFAATPRQPESLHGVAAVKAYEIAFLRSVKDKALFTPLNGLTGSPKDNAFRVENARTGTSLAVTGDLTPSRFHFFAHALTICPEPFIELKIFPGQEQTWMTQYTFAANGQ